MKLFIVQECYRLKRVESMVLAKDRDVAIAHVNRSLRHEQGYVGCLAEEVDDVKTLSATRKDKLFTLLQTTIASRQEQIRDLQADLHVMTGFVDQLTG
jgi:hypothetical protein